MVSEPVGRTMLAAAPATFVAVTVNFSGPSLSVSPTTGTEIFPDNEPAGIVTVPVRLVKSEPAVALPAVVLNVTTVGTGDVFESVTGTLRACVPTLPSAAEASP